MTNKITKWFKRRKELKELEKKIDEKVEKEGMYYMLEPNYPLKKGWGV